MTEPMNAKDIELSKNIKMKLYDEYGMPLSNYDYSKHFAVLILLFLSKYVFRNKELEENLYSRQQLIK